jgi:hypothetical protein
MCKATTTPTTVTITGCALQTSLPFASSLRLPPELQFCNEANDITMDEARQLADMTTQQSASQQWYDARRPRLTASVFGEIMKRKADINESFMSRLFTDQNFKTAATQHGKQNETKAKELYVQRNPGVHIHDCGFVVNPSFSFLGATPDGKVCDSGQLGLLEVKCPYKYRDSNLADAVCDQTFCLEQLGGSKIQLKRSHSYYYQIQGQLMVTGASFCDLVVYTSCDSHTERIVPDISFQQTMLNKLATFYYLHGLPYIQQQAQRAVVGTSES